MKFYDFSLAPNPRRVRIFLAEKGVTIDSVQINTREGEQFGEAFQKVNPLGTVPVLELDDGTCITESVAICRYIEAMHPEPALMGIDAKDAAVVEMWNRRVEINAFGAIGEAARNSLPLFADRAIAGVPGGVPQIPALVDRGKQTMERFLLYLNGELAGREFIAGERFSIADITMVAAVGFAQRVEYEVPSTCGNVTRWYESVSARESMQA